MILEIVHNEETGVVAGIVGRNDISTFLECRHTVITFNQLVDSCYAILSFGINLLAMKLAQQELTIL